MSNVAIHPVILCGGSGTRLWPLSRKSYPKQFARFMGDESLFQASVRRLSGAGYAAPVVVSASDYRFVVVEQLQEAGIDPGAVLIEPAPRNTAPAVLAAALHIAAQDAHALILIAPADHVVPDGEAFRAAVATGTPAALAGRIVTFGIEPDRPETGYGYLELGQGQGPALPLKRFVEKPDLARAEAMLETGGFLWNAGIFLATAATLIAAYRDHAPEVLSAVTAAVGGAKTDLGFLRLDPAAWVGAPSISIDYAVMEKAENLDVVPFGGLWSDLGGWDAVWRASEQDKAGLALGGAAVGIDCHDTLLRAEDPDQVLVGIGLRDIIAIAMPDAVLVADRNRAQEVKIAVDSLKSRSARQAESFPRDYRPWGWFQSLAIADRFQVKRIVVKPGAALSLQSHRHRSEHWIVVRGTATVTLGEERRLVTENQSVYIPLGTVHRLENEGKLDLHLIEVQTGAYLGEDDIIRYEDLYARG